MQKKISKLWLAIFLLFILVGVFAYTDYKDDQLQKCVIENMSILDYEGALDYCKNRQD